MQLIDSTVFLWLNASPASPVWGLKLALFASQELPGLIVAGLIGALLVGQPEIRRRVLQVLLSMALAWTLARLGQHVLHMPRPFMLGLGSQWLMHGNSAGFPSTHASVAFAFAATAAVTARSRLICAATFFVAILIAWSRICLGLHFPSDVLAGLIVGLVCAQLSRLAFQRSVHTRTVH